MKNKAVLIAVAVVVLLAGGFALWSMVLQDRLGLGEAAAVLSLQPNKGRFSTTSPFQVEVWVNTRNKPVDGTDVFLSFDPELMEAADISFEGGVFPNTPSQDFILRQSKTGMLRFSALVELGSSFTGQGKIATITFDPLKSGSASLKFVFEKKGSTIDSNVGYHGVDLLGRVVNGSYNLIDHVE
jgi:hypothetical protein